jgi:hypothetical protein
MPASIPALPTDGLDYLALLAHMPASWEETVEAHGLISSHRFARVAGPKQLMYLVLVHAGLDLPLRQTVHWATEAGLPSISHVTLHTKMKRVGPCLEELIAAMADQRMGVEREKWGGYEVVAIDGSVVVKPGPSGAGGRLHVVLRLADLCVVGAQITATDKGETLRRFGWREGQLVLADRGYANPAGVAHVVAEGADILVRVNRSALPLFDDVGQRIDLLSWTRDLAPGKAHHRSAMVVHGDTAIPGRLVAKRLPEGKIAEAQERARREVGDDAETLELACWVLIFTTAPESRLTDLQVVESYRVRWQIELLFKRWKSLCHIDRMPNYRPDTLVSWLSVKMILLMLLERMADSVTRAESVSESVAEPVAESVAEPGNRPVAKAKPRRSPAVLRRQAWKLTSIVWPAIMAALVPSSLRHVVEHLPQLADVLDQDHLRSNPRQVKTFVDMLGMRATEPRVA